MLLSFKSKIGNVFCPIHLWGFSNGVIMQKSEIELFYATHTFNSEVSLHSWLLWLISRRRGWLSRAAAGRIGRRAVKMLLPRLIISTSSSSWCNCQKNRQNFCNVAEIPRFFKTAMPSNCISPLPSYGRYFQIPPYKLVNFKMRLLSFYFLVKSTAAVPSLVVNLVEKVVM